MRKLAKDEALFRKLAEESFRPSEEVIKFLSEWKDGQDLREILATLQIKNHAPHLRLQLLNGLLSMAINHGRIIGQNEIVAKREAVLRK